MVNVYEAIRNLKKKCENTDLLHDMYKRKGNYVIHKGSYEPHILFIGEAGGKQEDKVGIPFVGKSGTLLNKWIESINITKNNPVAIINAVPIMPENVHGGIRKPTDKEIKHFRPEFLELISALNPKWIILLGRSAEKAYFETCNLLQNTEWYLNVGLIYHPSYYLRKGSNGTQDFIKLMRYLK